MTLTGFPDTDYLRADGDGRFTEKSQSSPQIALDCEYPELAVTVNANQDAALSWYTSEFELDTPAFLRAEDGGRVTATFVDPEAYESMREVTIEEDGTLGDSYFVIGYQKEPWQRSAAALTADVPLSSGPSATVVPTAAQSAAASQMSHADFRTSVGRDADGVLTVLMIRNDAQTAYRTRLHPNGTAKGTDEYIEGVNGEMAWSPLKQAQAKRFAKTGPTA